MRRKGRESATPTSRNSVLTRRSSLIKGDDSDRRIALALEASFHCAECSEFRISALQTINLRACCAHFRSCVRQNAGFCRIKFACAESRVLANAATLGCGSPAPSSPVLCVVTLSFDLSGNLKRQHRGLESAEIRERPAKTCGEQSIVTCQLRVPCHRVCDFLRNYVEPLIEQFIRDHQRSQEANDAAVNSGTKNQHPA